MYMLTNGKYAFRIGKLVSVIFEKIKFSKNEEKLLMKNFGSDCNRANIKILFN